MLNSWEYAIQADYPEAEVRYSTFDYADTVYSDQEDYDLRIVQLPLRYIYPEIVVMQNRFDDLAAYERELTNSFDRLRGVMSLLRNPRVDQPTFFLNYFYPQHNALGRLMPRYDPRSPTFFIQRLNRHLYDLVADFPGGHVLDIEQIASAFGRHRLQDDAFATFSHASITSDYDYYFDVNRLEAEEPLSKRYPHDPAGFIRVAWTEALAMLRTLRGTDRVKLICVDLDDTLWRGVLAEADDVDVSATEGWPLAFAEALMICKQRGIILAIISKNDEARVAEILPRVFHTRVRLEDFAIRKINWDPKPQNVAAAIREANVLPDSVVYIDDNPVERAAVKALLPEVRTLGAPHLDWRRILLWSPETQLAEISSESAQRSEMVRAQVEREQDRKAMSYADFLAELELRVELGQIASTADPHFARALELINKTNQFNTTGERWTEDDARHSLPPEGAGGCSACRIAIPHMGWWACFCRKPCGLSNS
jgi:FkbH-like protein